MKITFLGACHEVTGSRTLLEWRDHRFALVDCGMEQGKDMFANADMPVSAEQIEYVLITHAHIDHTGLLPLLYRQGFRGRVYASRETARLCRIMLMDSASIQESDAQWQTRKNLRAGRPPVEPLYTAEDVEALMELFVPCAYRETIHVDEGLSIRFQDIGHLLGSAAIECWMEEDGQQKKLVFSGDVGNTRQPLIRDPQPIRDADYLMIESTYGDRLHDRRIDPLPMLTDVIQRTLDRGGNVIIPSFAVGRTQELLYFIREIKDQRLIHGHDRFPVYVDSPLGSEATEIFTHCGRECLDDAAQAVLNSGRNPIAFPGLHTLATVADSQALNTDPTPKVIIASSGMCEGGRIRHHMKHNLWRPECTLLFVGFQSPGTLGRTIYDGAKSIKLLGEEITVNCEVRLLTGVSGHADRDGLLRWEEGFERKPARIFVNHGEDAVCSAFAETLTERFGVPAEAPYSGSTFDLLAGAWVLQQEAQPLRADTGTKQSAAKQKKSDRFEALLQAVAALENAAHGCRELASRDVQRWTQRIKAITEEMIDR